MKRQAKTVFECLKFVSNISIMFKIHTYPECSFSKNYPAGSMKIKNSHLFFLLLQRKKAEPRLASQACVAVGDNKTSGRLLRRK